ncbi:MAG: HAD family hydrolase [Gemmatimonadetes bacterium]|nr:HAD family hydrolase [Gemmatimonadota bacterium]
MTAHPDWRAVLFDLDGTLADTVPLIRRCYRHTMTTHRGRELPDELWLRTLGRPLRASFTEFTVDPAEAAQMVATYVDFQRTVHDDMVCAFPAALDAIAKLRARGARVGVITSKGREMTGRTLTCCGLADLDVLVTADDVVRGKPDPEHVLKGLAQLGLEGNAEEVLFVGDSTHDIEAGKSAGVRTAAALWGPFTRADPEGSRPDYWVADFEELLALRPGP